MTTDDRRSSFRLFDTSTPDRGHTPLRRPAERPVPQRLDPTADPLTDPRGFPPVRSTDRPAASRRVTPSAVRPERTARPDVSRLVDSPRTGASADSRRADTSAREEEPVVEETESRSATRRRLKKKNRLVAFFKGLPDKVENFDSSGLEAFDDKYQVTNRVLFVLCTMFAMLCFVAGAVAVWRMLIVEVNFVSVLVSLMSFAFASFLVLVASVAWVKIRNSITKLRQPTWLR